MQINRQLSNARIIAGSMHMHMTIVDIDNGKVNYVADNKMPQQMAFHEVVCCLHRCQI